MEMVIKIGSKTMSVKMLIFAIVCALIGLTIAVYTSEKEYDYLEQTYHVVRLEDSFRGVVNDVYFNHETYLRLNDSICITLFSMENGAYKPPEFYKFIQCNDLMVKNANSDTIYVYRKNQKYYFILSDTHEYLYKHGNIKKKEIIDDNVLRPQ
jgi:hypothetical protein